MNDYNFIIIIDTRETTPFEFPGRKTIVKTLKSGDYSILGFENIISIERKAAGDFLGCCSSKEDKRENFLKEMERLSHFQRKYLVIECNLAYLLKGDYGYTRINPNSVLGTLAKIAVEYNVAPIFAGGHRDGATITERILDQFYEKFRGGKI